MRFCLRDLSNIVWEIHPGRSAPITIVSPRGDNSLKSIISFLLVPESHEIYIARQDNINKEADNPPNGRNTG